MDLLLLWNFCTSLNPADPRSALLPSLGLRLVGPFDVLAGVNVINSHLHHRFALLHYKMSAIFLNLKFHLFPILKVFLRPTRIVYSVSECGW